MGKTLQLRSARRRLLAVKLVHTVVWAFFAGCIFAIPIVGWLEYFSAALVLVAIVLVEVGILAANGWRCPLTPVAARYTSDRRANFDIFLPEWIARHNKIIFGGLYCIGILVVLYSWLG